MRVLIGAALAATVVALASGPAYAQIPPNVLVNRLGEDTTTQDTQSETTIVLGAPPNIIVGFNDSGSSLFGAHFTGLSLSTNGGNTFTDLGVLPAGPSGDAGDPVAVRDTTSGTIYLATLASAGTAMQVFRSFNNGATIAAPVNGAPAFLGGDFLDKPWIAVDNVAGAGRGNVYLTLTDFTGFGPARGISLTRSTNGGATWTPAGGTLIAGPGNCGVQGSFVAVGPKHEVYVFWWDHAAGCGTPELIRVRKSTNQGLTFGAPVTVARLSSLQQNGDLGLAGGFRTDSFPRAAVNPANGNAYVVFNSAGGVADRADIFFAQSTNGGATWSPPRRVNDDKTANDQWSPTLAVTPDGKHLFVGFYDRRLSPNNTAIDYFGAVAAVAGGNVAFGPNFRLSSQTFPVVVGQDGSVKPTYMGDYDHAVADNAAFFATWSDNRLPDRFFPHQPDVRFARIPIVAAVSTPTPTSTPVPAGVTEVFRCAQAAPNLGFSYGVGILITHPQFCFAGGGPVVQPLAVPASVATDTGLRVPPSLPVFVCNQAAPNLGSAYGIGVLTVDPQFCFSGGPTPPPIGVAATVARDTGIRINPNATPVFRCLQLAPNLAAFYGVGVLTTHPQFCFAGGGPLTAPGTVPAGVAIDTGIRVP